MNITLSADQKLIEQARHFAKQHNTSLNNLIRRYLQSLGLEKEKASQAKEFADLAKQFPGHSLKEFKFSRDLIYDRILEET